MAKREYDLVKALSPFIPEKAIAGVLELIGNHPVHIKLTMGRHSKLGDYRSPLNDGYHQITVNADLNPYAFLLTFLHEWAHLLVYSEYKHHVKPHGAEWKSIFAQIAKPFVEHNIFPDDVTLALRKYFKNPLASTATDIHLNRLLERYGKRWKDEKEKMLEELPFDASFIYRSKLFRKKEKINKMYRCIELKTGTIYRFHPLAPVHLTETEE